MSRVKDVQDILDEIFDERDALEEMKQKFFDDLLEDHRVMRRALKTYGKIYNIDAIIGEDGLLVNLKVKGA